MAEAHRLCGFGGRARFEGPIAGAVPNLATYQMSRAEIDRTSVVNTVRMFLRRVDVQGYRAAAHQTLTCEFTGNFNLLIGANASGKTTINEAILHAHHHRFPRLPAVDAAALGPLPRGVSISYAFNEDQETEGALGNALRRGGKPAPSWSRPLERSLGKVRAGPAVGATEAIDRLRLIYLPAMRNPVDELSRRDARILLELFRAEQARNGGSATLGNLRSRAQGMLASLVGDPLVVGVQERIAANLRAFSGGVLEHHAFVGTQTVDDAYLARVLELLLAAVPDPLAAQRLEVSSLGYVNLLHIAVVLAGIPDLTQPRLSVEGGVPDSADGGQAAPELMGPPDEAEAARARLAAASEEAEADQDSFFPDLFHATVLIEEPEAHLHPQLQYGLIRYLKKVAVDRPDLQLIITTHSGELASAVDPSDLIITGTNPAGGFTSRTLTALPLASTKREWLLQQTRLHMDADRSGALFADRLLIVEGVTEAALLRTVARVWAGNDDRKAAFAEALSILPVGHAIGEWPIRLVATPGYELVHRAAALSDTDLRGDPLPEAVPPQWHSELHSDTARFFWSRPTLEPTLVVGNEELVSTALSEAQVTYANPITPAIVDAAFVTQRKKKASFALALAAGIKQNPKEFHVPGHITKMLDWLYGSSDNEPSSESDTKVETQ